MNSDKSEIGLGKNIQLVRRSDRRKSLVEGEFELLFLAPPTSMPAEFQQTGNLVRFSGAIRRLKDNSGFQLHSSQDSVSVMDKDVLWVMRNRTHYWGQADRALAVDISVVHPDITSA